jgi:tRNA(Phe) wybutosine-synthesizing methylase Tyw3
MNLFVLFFLIEIGLVIIVSIEVVKKYNSMVIEKFTYLKNKMDYLEIQIEKLSKINKDKNKINKKKNK